MTLRTEQEIMKDWRGDLTAPVVSVCCTTYNHEGYISQAIDGFLMQETDFPFEIIIRDDCSTDKTADIVREYAEKFPTIIKPIFEIENQYSKGVKPMPVVYKKAVGEYFALCEGDDYWTNADKLSRQIYFLQNNLKYSFCWTRFKTLDAISGIEENDRNEKYFTKITEEGVEFSLDHFCRQGWHIGMQTLVYRKEAFNYEVSKNAYYKDIFMISDFLNKGVGYCLSGFCAIYRIHDGGVYSGASDWDGAVQGANTYREIASAFSNQKMLRQKYFLYSNRLLIKCLLKSEFKLFIKEFKNRLFFQSGYELTVSFFYALTRECALKVFKKC